MLDARQTDYRESSVRKSTAVAPRLVTHDDPSVVPKPRSPSGLANQRLVETGLSSVIGVHMALGSIATGVVWLLLREVLRLIALAC